MQDLSSHGARTILGARLPQGWRGLGFAPQVVERVLNHVSGAQGGLVGVYQKHQYRVVERKAAMLAWGNYVEKLTAPDEASNVVDFPSAAE